MILEEETYKRFGYFPSDLSPKSSKKICAACDDCGKVRELTKQCYRALCKSCVQKGNQNRYGKYHSEETLKKMSKAQKRRLEGKNNSFLGKHHTKEAKQKISKANKGKFLGEKSPHWKNGASFEPYCSKFNNAFKEYIRAKFGNVCFLCGKTEEENGRKLSVHHVNYDKHCGCAETEEDTKADDASCQFIPLCISCNAKVNFNRDMWERRIKNKMKNKLNGWVI